MSDCRVTQDTNEHYDNMDKLEAEQCQEREAKLERVYNNPDIIQGSLTMDIIDFYGTRNEEADYWRKLMLEIGDAHKNKDMQKIGMLLYPHMKAYIDYMVD